MVIRFFAVWGLLHVVLFLVELVRYKLSNTSLKFKYYFDTQVLDITHLVCAADIILCLLFIGYICYNFITKGTLL